MKKTLLLKLLITMSVMLLQACSNTKPQIAAGTMRIWVSPSLRSDVKVDSDGNVYVNVLN